MAEQLDQSVCAALNQIGTSLRNETLSRPKPLPRSDLGEEARRITRFVSGGTASAHSTRPPSSGVGERVTTVRSTAASNLSPRAPALRQPSASCNGVTVMGSTCCC